MKRLIVGITGASGALLGIRLAQVVKQLNLAETHLIITPAARLTITHETEWAISNVQALAAHWYEPDNISAVIASGSFTTAGMVIIPCSIKTLSAIAHSYTADLVTRAADVTLKEGRPLLMVVREAPLHSGHLELMAQAAHLGAVIFPPVPAFYARPQTCAEIVDDIVGRVLLRLGFDNDLYHVWQG